MARMKAEKLRLKHQMKGDLFVYWLDCDRCKVKSSKKGLLWVQDGSKAMQLCKVCAYKAHPELFEVLED